MGVKAWVGFECHEVSIDGMGLRHESTAKTTFNTLCELLGELSVPQEERGRVLYESCGVINPMERA